MVIGLYLNFVLYFMTVDADAYNMTKLIMMGFAVLIGAYAILRRCTLEGDARSVHLSATSCSPPTKCCRPRMASW